MPADIVDILPFHARQPRLGHSFRLLGYLGLVAVLVQEGRAPAWLLPLLTCLLILLWVIAWRLQVGTLWRSSLVAASLAAFVLLTLRCGVCS